MRLAVIGLDCATPQLVFDQFRRDLPLRWALRARAGKQVILVGGGGRCSRPMGGARPCRG